MSHNIETFEGHAAFVTARDHAWHSLGTVLDESFDAETALQVAHLADWNVRKAPLTADVPAAWDADGNPTEYLKVPVADKFAIVRDNPFEPGKVDALGVVGNHYAAVQNEEHVELLNTLTDESGAHFETAGSLRGGREVFVSMKMPETIKVGGKDPVDLYLIARNSHDGSSSFQFLVSPVRVVCSNTLALAMSKAKSSFKARHVQGGARAAIQQAREALGMTFAFVEEFDRQVERMIEQEYTDQQFSRLTASLYPTPKDAGDTAVANAKLHRGNLAALFRTSPTMADIRGTRWAAYNAVTEYADHVAEVRGKAGDAARQARALNVATGMSAGLKERAFSLLTA